MESAPTSGKVTATSGDIARLRARVKQSGSNAVARELGLSTHAIDRVLAALPVHAGTMLVVRTALAANGRKSRT